MTTRYAPFADEDEEVSNYCIPRNRNRNTSKPKKMKTLSTVEFVIECWRVCQPNVGYVIPRSRLHWCLETLNRLLAEKISPATYVVEEEELFQAFDTCIPKRFWCDDEVLDEVAQPSDVKIESAGLTTAVDGVEEQQEQESVPVRSPRNFGKEVLVQQEEPDNFSAIQKKARGAPFIFFWKMMNMLLLKVSSSIREQQETTLRAAPTQLSGSEQSSASSSRSPRSPREYLTSFSSLSPRGEGSRAHSKTKKPSPRDHILAVNDVPVFLELQTFLDGVLNSLTDFEKDKTPKLKLDPELAEEQKQEEHLSEIWAPDVSLELVKRKIRAAKESSDCVLFWHRCDEVVDVCFKPEHPASSPREEMNDDGEKPKRTDSPEDDYSNLTFENFALLMNLWMIEANLVYQEQVGMIKHGGIMEQQRKSMSNRQQAATASGKSTPSATPRGRPVYCNVYDVQKGEEWIQKLNRFLANRHMPSFLKLGGIFHAGIEIDELEWSYGATLQESAVGVCCNYEPKKHPQHNFRETILLGYTHHTPEEIADMISEFIESWRGEDYKLLSHNCCHFADDFAQRLGVGKIPRWIHRLARWGAALDLDKRLADGSDDE